MAGAPGYSNWRQCYLARANRTDRSDVLARSGAEIAPAELAGDGGRRGQPGEIVKQGVRMRPDACVVTAHAIHERGSLRRLLRPGEAEIAVLDPTGEILPPGFGVELQRIGAIRAADDLRCAVGRGRQHH